ncbi:MAG: hypothetical protein ACYDBT_09445 [Desulfobulbaceae bacterium]
MIHHVHVPRTVLACALLALVAAVNPVRAADDGGSFTSLSVSDPGLQSAAAPATITPAVPTPSTNGLLRFTSQAEFETAFPGLPKEDFEESPVAAGTFTLCTGPLDSSTNQPPNCFVPGDILPGLSIDSDPGHQLPVTGIGFGGLTASSVTLGSTPLSDVISISFSGSSVNAVGMDLVAFAAGGTYTIKVYGNGNVLLDTITSPVVSTAETFFGIYSSSNITKITLDNGSNEVVDNLQFGGTPNLTFYTSQAAFTAAHPGLPVEDFEESPIADTGFLGFPGPLDSTSNIPGAFSPGDILPGLRINGVTTNIMAVIGGNHLNFGNTTKVVLENNFLDGLRIDFTNYDAYAVGMDLMRAWAQGNVTITVYGPHGIFLGTTTKTIQLSETFVGVYSNQPITRIEVLNAADVDMVDNIRFGGTPVGLTFYNSQASFLMAKPGLPVEDFEESPVAPGVVSLCTQPINSATNEADCFAPGDIIPGISFQALAPCAGSCNMVILGDGVAGAPTKVIGPNSWIDNLEMTFAKNNVRYFGTDALVLAGGPADMLFSLYDDHDNFIGSALRNIGTTPVYFGVVSSRHLSRITITDPSGLAGELVDNVRFGAFPWQTIIPAISGH